VGDDAEEWFVRPFVRRDSRLSAILDADERAIVARVVADVGFLLGAEPFGMDLESREPAKPDDLFSNLRGLEDSLAEPDDPALLRLLPNAVPTDPEAADEFRRLTEPDLRTLKAERLLRVWEQLSEPGPEWEIDDQEAMSTAGALTDVRLVLASRLGLVTDDDAEALRDEIENAMTALGGEPADDPTMDRERVWLGMLYQALTWLEDSLIACVMDHETAGKGENDE
jgi:hypothetical protein